jgi:ferredoxin
VSVYSFVEGPLLWFVFLILLVGMAIRLIFFLHAILRRGRYRELKGVFPTSSLWRFLLSYQRVFRRRPIFTATYYIFHSCLFIVPIFLNGHITLWEESRFGWTWTSLPENLADGLTLLLVVLFIYFILRRFLVLEIRRNSSVFDYVFLLVVIFPFLTGFLLAHESLLVAHSFLMNHIYIFHIFSGECLVILIPFLFCKLDLIEDKCLGCAVCVDACPTGALFYKDKGELLRVFSYLQYQCISCGSCIGVCPESASELRHEVGIRRLFQINYPDSILSVLLSKCEKCGALFAPEPQIKKIKQRLPGSYLSFCPRCRSYRLVEFLEATAFQTRTQRLKRFKEKKFDL